MIQPLQLQQQRPHHFQPLFVDHLRDRRDATGLRQRHSLLRQIVHPRQQDELQPLVKIQGIHGEGLHTGEGLLAGRLALPQAGAAQFALYVEQDFGYCDMAVSHESSSKRKGGREFRIALP